MKDNKVNLLTFWSKEFKAGNSLLMERLERDRECMQTIEKYLAAIDQGSMLNIPA